MNKDEEREFNFQKGTGAVILNEPFMDWHDQFTTVPFTLCQMSNVFLIIFKSGLSVKVTCRLLATEALEKIAKVVKHFKIWKNDDIFHNRNQVQSVPL